MNGRIVSVTFLLIILLAFLASRSCERVAVHGIDAAATRSAASDPDAVSQAIEESLHASAPKEEGGAGWVAWLLFPPLTLFACSQLVKYGGEMVRQRRLSRRRRRPAARRDLPAVPRVPQLRPVNDEYYD